MALEPLRVHTSGNYHGFVNVAIIALLMVRLKSTLPAVVALDSMATSIIPPWKKAMKVKPDKPLVKAIWNVFRRNKTKPR